MKFEGREKQSEKRRRTERPGGLFGAVGIETKKPGTLRRKPNVAWGRAKKEGRVMKRTLFFTVLGGISLLIVNACSSMGNMDAMGGQESMGSKMSGGEMMDSGGSYLLPPDKVKGMMQMMMSMKPDTLEAGLKRGEKLFYDETLGGNTSRKSCGTCHEDGGTVGGAAEMEWKGMKMKVNIPTLRGAAAHFPKPMGPMKALVDLAGMNNMCIMTFLKGAPIDKNSQQSIDLVAYVTSFSKGKSLEPGKEKIVPRPVPGAM